MGKDCCGGDKGLDLLAKKQSRVLWIVLIINSIFFVIEFCSGIFSQSVSLTGDSLDMLGDALTYGVSIYVVGKTAQLKVKASYLKSFLMILTALFVLTRATNTFFGQVIPSYEIMGVVSFLALIANSICLWLLSKHKNDDINFTSVWICSRNDIITNISVIIAGALVFATNSLWPDLIIGLGITILFTKSAIGIWSEARTSRDY